MIDKSGSANTDSQVLKVDSGALNIIKEKKHRKFQPLSLRFIFKAIGGALVATFLIFFIIHFIINPRLQHDPLPEKIKQAVSFPLYYPTKIPSGFRFVEAAYDPETKVVSYDYSTVDGNKIFFTLQPKPSDFDFNNFNNKQISGGTQISTKFGSGTVGILEKQTVSSIITDKTWILIGSGEKVNVQQLEQISQSLAKVKE